MVKLEIIMVMFTAVLMNLTAAQTVHEVGDGMGWAVPSSSGAYTTWAANKNFIVGDILLFNFVTNGHDVQQVTKESYDACSTANVIGPLITAGPANVTLDTTGDHYFICTLGRHCQSGQKLSVNVGNSSSPGATTPNNSMPSPPTPFTPTTPSPAAYCPPPTMSESPAGGPTGSTVSPPGSSSSSVVSASVFVPMFFISMGLIF